MTILSHYQPFGYHYTGNCFNRNDFSPHNAPLWNCRYLQVQIFILSKLVGYRNMVSVASWKRWKNKTLWHFQIQIQNSIHKIEFWKRFHNLLSCFPLIYTVVWIYIFINFWWKVMHSDVKLQNVTIWKAFTMEFYIYSWNRSPISLFSTTE